MPYPPNPLQRSPGELELDAAQTLADAILAGTANRQQVEQMAKFTHTVIADLRNMRRAARIFFNAGDTPGVTPLRRPARLPAGGPGA